MQGAPCSVQQWLHIARQQLAQSVPSDEANIEAQLLLMYVLQVNRAWLIAHAHDLLEPTSLTKVDILMQRRLLGEPIAFILGMREFFGLTLKVTSDTLIPRPDTETLVEAALERIQHLAHGKPLQILDLGTGTGAIALAIARHAPGCMVTAVDASSAALAVAEQNAMALGMGNVRFVLSDWFSSLTTQYYDVIVSNPPYIEADDPHLKQGDVRFEPMRALASGADGLQDIRQIVSQAPRHLQTNGWLMLEHGYNQAEAVQQLLHSTGFQQIQTVRDLGGNPRVTQGQWQATRNL